MEEDLRLHHLEKGKAKVTVGPLGSAPQRPRLTYQTPPRPFFQQPRQQPLMIRPAPQNVQRPQYYRPPQQQVNTRATAPLQGPRHQHPCFNCGRVGHFLPNYPLPRRLPPTHKQGPTRANRKKKRTTKLGRVNHLQISEAPTGAPVMAGMFLAHGYLAILLLI